MKIKSIFWLYLCLFVISCASNDTSEDGQETVIEASELDETTWEGFWQLFQQAAADKDKEALQALCIFNADFLEENFQSSFDVFFGDGMIELIGNTKENALFSQENMLDDVEEVRSIQLIETGKDEETGETYESALIILFGKRDGKFGMVRWGMAG